MSAPVKKFATYADLEAVPPHLVAEIIYGSLETHPRPAMRHATVASQLGYELIGPFNRGRGGPGGWHIVDEPELHLGRNVVVPDIAGWRRERLPEIPDTAYLEMPPDWVCEILSPATSKLDRGSKRSIYAEAGVLHLWLIDPQERVIEAFQITAGRWLLVGVATGSDQVRLPPFEAVSFSLDALFQANAPSSNAPTSQG